MRIGEIGLGGQESAKLADFGMIGAVAQWCECLHGKSTLQRSLLMMATGIDAEAAAIVRYGRSGSAEGVALTWDAAPVDTRGGRLDRGFARALLGEYFDAARPGSLWYRSMLDDVSADLRDFHAARVLRELVVIPLEVNDRHVDTVELHFADKPRNFQQMLLNSLAPVVAQTWANRAQGLFTEAALHRAEQKREPARGVPVLSSENPARLSRAEYRVGLMLSRGMTSDEVKAALDIQESTLRTHLGNLYAKTGASSLSELVFLLVSAAPHGARAVVRPARLA